MKRLLRTTVGLMTALPFHALIHLCALFTGKDRAVEIFGPVASALITRTAEFILIPRVDDPDKFDEFRAKITRNAAFLRPLYDVSVVYQDSDRIVFNYRNCPHCEAFRALGLAQVNPYICDGDWQIAKRHSSAWDFQRSHQIGAGDDHCDHTYLRKQRPPLA